MRTPHGVASYVRTRKVNRRGRHELVDLIGRLTALGRYRFTPRNASAVVVVSQFPATFQLAGVLGFVVPVPGGRLHSVAKPCSAAGFWITAGL